MPTPAPTSLRIQYVPLDEIVGADRNAKEHAVAEIARAVTQFGFLDPVILDERTGRLVGGHGRLKALRRLRDENKTAPSGIDPSNGWMVPVTHGWASVSDEHAEAANLALNRTHDLGGYDERTLAEILDDLYDTAPNYAEATGYTQQDLDDLIASLADENDGGGDRSLRSDADDAPDVADEDAPTIAQLGDVWLLGPHKVVCGDSTDRDVVAALMGGERADAMWTDPPYGVSYVGKTADALTIENDGSKGLELLLDGAFARANEVLKPGAPLYVAHADMARVIFETAFKGAGWLFRQNLIWVKNAMVLGRSDYHYRHEPVLYGFTPGGQGKLGRGGDRWYGDDSQTTVFEVDKPSRSESHPTMKPVKLITGMLINSVRKGGVVYEPFGGSGSTLIAAHTLGLTARVIELAPRYVDVICGRFEQLTGQVPRRASDGEEVSFFKG